MHVLDTKDRKEPRKVVLSKFSSMRKKKKNMKKCKIYTVPGSSHTGFFLTTDHKSLHLCNEVTVDFTSLLIYVFASKCLLYLKKREDQEGGRNFFFFLQQIYVMCPNLLLPLPLVQHRAAASLKGLISKDVPETSPTAAP